VEISENSENHLKAIVGGRQVVGRDGFSGGAGKVAEKTQGEGKAVETGSRGWHSEVASANYIDLRDIGERPVCPQVSPGFRPQVSLSPPGFFEVFVRGAG
jgi:hypothetical protein